MGKRRLPKHERQQQKVARRALKAAKRQAAKDVQNAQARR
jgi:hypothetical protein